MYRVWRGICWRGLYILNAERNNRVGEQACWGCAGESDVVVLAKHRLYFCCIISLCIHVAGLALVRPPVTPMKPTARYSFIVQLEPLTPPPVHNAPVQIKQANIRSQPSPSPRHSTARPIAINTQPVTPQIGVEAAAPTKSAPPITQPNTAVILPPPSQKIDLEQLRQQVRDLVHEEQKPVVAGAQSYTVITELHKSLKTAKKDNGGYKITMGDGKVIYIQATS